MDESHEGLLGYEGGVLSCPYNMAHQIMPFRMAKHLVKCRKSYSGANKFKACPFNNTHMILEMEMKVHTQVCTDRGLLESYKYEIMSTPQTYPQAMGRTQEPVAEIPKKYLDDEVWDEDPPAKAYNPNEYCAKAPVIRKAFGTPAQRKAFRQAEFERHKEFKG